MQGKTTHIPVFASGLAIAPAVFAGSTLSGALTYAAFFSAVTFTALFLVAAPPQNTICAAYNIIYRCRRSCVYSLLHLF
ncbi:MAG: hypothetical protein L6V87_05215 [Ruminococcus sp.]|nr:MAG: hypothetical protein L6V87_05215 [Ruminococcus sp.]